MRCCKLYTQLSDPCRSELMLFFWKAALARPELLMLCTTLPTTSWCGQRPWWRTASCSLTAPRTGSGTRPTMPCPSDARRAPNWYAWGCPFGSWQSRVCPARGSYPSWTDRACQNRDWVPRSAGTGYLSCVPVGSQDKSASLNGVLSTRSSPWGVTPICAQGPAYQDLCLLMMIPLSSSATEGRAMTI